MTTGKARRWNLAALLVAAATGLGLALLPFGSSGTVDSNGVETTSSESLLSSEGSSVLIVLAIPVMLIVVPLLLRNQTLAYRSRIVIVVLLGIFVLLGALSIGLFFVPTLIAMVLSLAAQNSARSAEPSST